MNILKAFYTEHMTQLTGSPSTAGDPRGYRGISSPVFTRCAIFAAGEYYEEIPYLDKTSYVIAADGGLDYALATGATPHALIGDNDSLADPAAAGSLAEDTEIITLPSQKDDTDLSAAVKYAWDKGLHQFDIYGALGRQIDHTISSMTILALIAQSGGIAFLHGDHTIVTAICDARMEFPHGYVAPRRMVSIFAYSDVCTDVSVTGLKYGLDHATVKSINDFGSRNEFVGDTKSSIEVSSGTLLITYPSEAPYPTVVTQRDPAKSLGTVSTAVSSHLAH